MVSALVSLLNGTSTFEGYSMPKSSLLKNSSGISSIAWGKKKKKKKKKWVHTFP